MENFKNKKLLTGLLLVSLVLIMIGGTFAVIRFTGTSDQNLIKSGKVSMSYTESSNVINITDALPTEDEVGKNSTEFFDFTIMSKADTNADDNDGIKIPYNLIIEPKAVDSDKDALTNEQIKVYLTKVEGGTETQVIAPTKISELTPVDSNFKLYNTENVHKNNNGTITTNYRLRAWIDYGVESKDWNQTSKPKQYKFGVNVNATGEVNVAGMSAEAVGGAKTIIEKVGTDGLVAESHPETEQLQATTDYRYTGKNPNNYIYFNDEYWRIIGVFDVDDGTGKLEKRIKIIRNSLGRIKWDGAYASDWSRATVMQLLNEGDYWNRAGEHASASANPGLTDDAKSQIADAKWYLGGTNQNQTTTAAQFYSYERGKTVYKGDSATRPTSWTGKVGLMYPSDYGYATAGGSTTSKDACLAKEMYKWNNSEVSDCKNNDWLYDTDYAQWTPTPNSGYFDYAFYVNGTGNVNSYLVTDAYIVRPTVYLRADIKINGGSGTEFDPYLLTSKPPMPAEPVSGAKTIVEKVGTGGLVAETHSSTRQLIPTIDYRYTGKDPNNYIKFNNELWRIIGVFDTDNGTGKLEKRIKIIRTDSIKIAWNSNKENDWTNSTVMTLLNTGAYWNRSGAYATTGLTSEAKGQIADAKWYLGGIDYNTKTYYGLGSRCYSYERGALVYSGRPTNWVGKVGLMYPSDYGYATSGGTITNREACLAKKMSEWVKSDTSDCKNNDWLYDSNTNQWTITPFSGNDNNVFYVIKTGYVTESSGNDLADKTNASWPSVYLKSGIQITGGDGSVDTPYEISLS